MSKVLVVAEIGTAHGGSITKAKKLIDGVSATGAQAVKFQWVYADEILHKKTGIVKLPSGDTTLYDSFKKLECDVDFYGECKDYAHEKGLLFVCSPFGPRSLAELLSIKPDFLKIASPELNYVQLLQQVHDGAGATKIIVSSGVSKLSDIERALEILQDRAVTLLHCVTSYPAPATDYNVRLVATLRAIFGVETGISDHSTDPILVPVLSVLQGATVVEKHITLSHDTDGLDDKIALDVEQFSLMVHCIKQTEAALTRYGNEIGAEKVLEQLSDSYGAEFVEQVIGNGAKVLAKSEQANYTRTNRSLHYLDDMNAGEVVAATKIGILRTEKVLSVGLQPCFLDKVVGHRLTKAVKSGDGVQWEDFFA